jgi:hypothetical protein
VCSLVPRLFSRHPQRQAQSPTKCSSAMAQFDRGDRRGLASILPSLGAHRFIMLRRLTSSASVLLQPRAGILHRHRLRAERRSFSHSNGWAQIVCVHSFAFDTVDLLDDGVVLSMSTGADCELHQCLPCALREEVTTRSRVLLVGTQWHAKSLSKKARELGCAEAALEKWRRKIAKS